MVARVAESLVTFEGSVPRSGVAPVRVWSRTFDAMLVMIVILSVASFGAVYPWAYWPLLAACFSTGIIGIALAPDRSRINYLVVAALGTITMAVALQLVPLRATTLRQIAPATDEFLRWYDIRYSIGVSD